MARTLADTIADVLARAIVLGAYAVAVVVHWLYREVYAYIYGRAP